MAKARPVLSDMSSAEFDESRRALHALMLVLENVASEVDAGNITADEAFTVLLTSLQNGKDDDISGVDGGSNDYAGTGLTVAGVKPTPTHPRRARVRNTLEDMTANSDF